MSNVLPFKRIKNKNVLSYYSKIIYIDYYNELTSIYITLVFFLRNQHNKSHYMYKNIIVSIYMLVYFLFDINLMALYCIFVVVYTIASLLQY